MTFKLNRSRNEPMSEINVTPFVDVIGTLNYFYGNSTITNSRCPSRSARVCRRLSSDDQEPLTISINSKGEIYIQEHQVNYQKMVPKLLAIAKNRTDTRIYVRGDKNINYGRVLEVMGTLFWSWIF